MFDPQELAKTLGNLQEKLKEAQEESKNLTFSAKSGGGLVHITANGEGEVIDIGIDDSLGSNIFQLLFNCDDLVFFIY